VTLRILGLDPPHGRGDDILADLANPLATPANLRVGIGTKAPAAVTVP